MSVCLREYLFINKNLYLRNFGICQGVRRGVSQLQLARVKNNNFRLLTHTYCHHELMVYALKIN